MAVATPLMISLIEDEITVRILAYRIGDQVRHIFTDPDTPLNALEQYDPADLTPREQGKVVIKRRAGSAFLYYLPYRIVDKELRDLFSALGSFICENPTIDGEEYSATLLRRPIKCRQHFKLDSADSAIFDHSIQADGWIISDGTTPSSVLDRKIAEVEQTYVGYIEEINTLTEGCVVLTTTEVSTLIQTRQQLIDLCTAYKQSLNAANSTEISLREEELKYVEDILSEISGIDPRIFLEKTTAHSSVANYTALFALLKSRDKRLERLELTEDGFVLSVGNGLTISKSGEKISVDDPNNFLAMFISGGITAVRSARGPTLIR